MAARRFKQRAFGGSVTLTPSTGAVYIVNAGIAPGTSSFSIEFWAKISGESYAEAATHQLAGISTAAYATTGCLISQFANQLIFYSNPGTNVGITLPSSVRDTWTHFVVVYSSVSGISFYLNGELVSGPTARSCNITGTTLETGSGGLSGLKSGNMGQYRYWKGVALTTAQVAALFYDDLLPSTPYCEAKFSELSGASVANTGSLGVAFTIGATTWNIDTPPGQLRNALQNLLPQSNVFTNAVWTTSSLTATVSPLAHPTRPGANVYRLTEPVSGATPHAIGQAPSAPLTLSGRIIHWTVKVRGGGGRAFAGIFANGGAWGLFVQLSNGAAGTNSAQSYSITDLGNSWYQVDVVGVSDGILARIYLASANGVVTYAGDGSYIDVCDAQYRILDTSAEYLDTTTYAVLAGGQGAPPVQNLPLYSQDFSVASWSKTQLDAPVLVSANGGPGGLPIWRLTDTVAAGTHVMAQNVAADTRQPSLLRTITVVAKNETRGWIAVTYDAANQGAYFDLANGAIGTKFFQANSGATARIVALGDGWYSCSITCNAAIASNTTASVYLASADGVVTYAGNGSSVLIGSVSVSNTNGPTAYAATTLSAVNTGTPRYQTPQQNLIRFSNDMTQVAAFALTNLTSIVALGNVGPGGLPAFRMTDNVGAGGHYTSQTISPVPTIGRAYTLSANVRAGTKTAIVLAPEGAGFQVTYDLTAVTATTGIGAPLGTSITPLVDGWYRCALTFASAGASGYRFYISPTAYVADGTGTMDWCGLQLTEASGVANYVATGTATTNEGAPRGQVPLQNLLNNSEYIGAASWTVQAGSVVTIQPGLGVGGYNAALLDLTATAANQGVFQSCGNTGGSTPATPNRVYTMQCYMKAGSVADVGKIARIISPNGGTSQTLHTLTTEWVLVSLTEPYNGSAVQSSGLWVRKVAGGADLILVSQPSFSMASGVVPYAPTYTSTQYIREGAPRGQSPTT